MEMMIMAILSANENSGAISLCCNFRARITPRVLSGAMGMRPPVYLLTENLSWSSTTAKPQWTGTALTLAAVLLKICWDKKHCRLECVTWFSRPDTTKSGHKKKLHKCNGAGCARAVSPRVSIGEIKRQPTSGSVGRRKMLASKLRVALPNMVHKIFWAWEKKKSKFGILSFVWVPGKEQGPDFTRTALTHESENIWMFQIYPFHHDLAIFYTIFQTATLTTNMGKSDSEAEPS